MRLGLNPLAVALGHAIIGEQRRAPGPRVYYSVRPDGKRRWKVTVSGLPVDIGAGPFRLKLTAIYAARKMAKAMWVKGQKSGVRIANRKGQIRREWSYGHDPSETPG